VSDFPNEQRVVIDRVIVEITVGKEIAERSDDEDLKRLMLELEHVLRKYGCIG